MNFNNCNTWTALVLPLYLFLFSPLIFYFGNRPEIHFLLNDALPVVSLLIAAVAVVLYAILVLTIRFPLFHYVLVSFILGLAANIWIQVNIFSWDFGALDGRGVDWKVWQSHGFMEIAFWLGIFILFFVLLRGNAKVVQKVLLQGLYVIGVLSMFLAYFESPVRDVGKINIVTDNKIDEIFSFHPEKNTVIIVLDTFQSDYFDLVREKFPIEVSFLKGFTFYRNTISNFPSTRASIPAILTGRIYDNQVPFDDFVSAAYADNDLRRHYSNEGYSVTTVSNVSLQPDSFRMADVLDALEFDHIPPWLYFLDYGLFRGAPTLLKPFIYNESDWLLSYFARRDYPPGQFGIDIKFMEAFEHNFVVDRESIESGAFKLFHFFMPHDPYRIDEKLQYQNEYTGKEAYVKQARGALLLTSRLLEKMKVSGIYDSAEIFILADHGTSATSIPPLRGGSSDLNVFGVEARVQASALAVFMHKPPNSTQSDMVVNDFPFMLSDFNCFTFGCLNNDCSCEHLRSKAFLENRERSFLFYEISQSIWGRKFFPAMTEYVVDGHSYDPRSWRRSGKVFHESETVFVEVGMPDYLIGHKIVFSAENPPDRFLLNGWSFQENSHRWTDGDVAGVVFQLDHQPAADLEFHLRGQGYFKPDEDEAQFISVFVNGFLVAEWETGLNDDWYVAPIHTDLVGNDRRITVQLRIGKPGFSGDGQGRRVGFAAREMVIK